MYITILNIYVFKLQDQHRIVEPFSQFLHKATKCERIHSSIVAEMDPSGKSACQAGTACIFRCNFKTCKLIR